ncbi:type II toxin-antitoxin system VapC family toxin [Haloarcula salinisoli]|uniref:Ribonuclease VapC n=1 Tax=Haloarcula salinisoli TaxID=2487746 RepID=A0A8J7YBQ0_9EURY|nr:type II toxin-antitoxin system VapC family toxin [Halomicroarcula salinisoli]MBX0285910.1 type II toxin-antitoxin system VapC family toxin [Halomicroarcula salinisoli]MBX0302597.1 type II toxin-antitoxin system VapC family toxin [Halomicroarcula salinisoli]
MIQDTSFLIDILNGDEDATDVLELIERDNRPEKVAAITSLELYEGIGRSEKPAEEQRQVLAVLESKHVIPADHGIMKHAGELSASLITAGERIDREDCIIAATAIQENEPVLTRNAAHFDRVPNLDVESY